MKCEKKSEKFKMSAGVLKPKVKLEVAYSIHVQCGTKSCTVRDRMKFAANKN